MNHNWQYLVLILLTSFITTSLYKFEFDTLILEIFLRSLPQLLCSGLIQLLAGMCRLGFMSVLLTDTLVSAFTVGASLHVLTSQIKHILGLR